MARHPDKVLLLFGPFPPPPLRQAVRFLCFAVLAVLPGLVTGCSRGEESRPAENRLSQLEAEVGRQREASAKAVAEYAPKVPGRLDDLTLPAADLLRQLPGVVEVEALVSPARP